MAIGITTRLIDDLDGSDADSGSSHTKGGRRYEIDLPKKNATDLEQVLAPSGRSAVAHGRRPGARAARSA